MTALKDVQYLRKNKLLKQAFFFQLQKSGVSLTQ